VPTAHPQSTTVAWIGTGVMGATMCAHVLAAGYRVTVHSRTRSKAEPLLARGARWAESPAAAAGLADVVVTMVGFPQDVEEVYFGGQGLVQAVGVGTVAVDMTTTRPSLAVRIHEALARRGAHGIDAPVSGGDVGAREARLSIMVGGAPQAVTAVMPLLQVLGRQIVHQGPAGCGQHAKMCNQVVIASTMIGVCECLMYGRRAGLDLPTMLTSIAGGAAACWTLDNLAPRILKDNFDPGFMVDHFIKDMQIALEEARRLGLALPGLALAEELYRALQEQGHGRRGTHALIKALELLSSTEC
jgi:3-hydroxyisobutyrate dehydrogenase